jgi:lipid-binding SYLF domain-containing protein
MTRLQGFKTALVGLSLIALSGCMSPEGATMADKRHSAAQMRSETLANLYRSHPQAKEQIQRAVGYAVFSNLGIKFVFLSAGNGWGIARDNRSGRDIYMKMVTAGVGIGLGVKDFRGVFVFTDRAAFVRFTEDGWDASAQADAAAKAGDKGGAFAGAIDVAPGIKLYQLTENGLALQATIQGTKYWRDGDLNASTAKNF